MQEPEIYILSTRPVDASLVEMAREQGIVLDILSFIDTEPIRTVEVQQEIELAAVEVATVVFTSMNAVESVTEMLDGHVPEWTIYCMGHKTRELVENYFGEEAIAGTADSASQLAEEIIEDAYAGEVIFFCGNQRREELPAKLAAADITVTEITVYQTIVLPRKVEGEYNGILFFSPSAVESFFAKNQLPAHTVVFAIGPTTKETIERYCSNKIISSLSPAKDKMLEQAMAYFRP
ncbi:MAG: uroporphyrinogen-III synthase [Sediminibacterium sp.]|nr:uroporphyrinogen-III synthase [Sediminibacterium sp.]